MKSLKLFTLMMLLTMIAGAAYAGCGDSACSSSCTDECEESQISVSGQLRYRFNTEGFDFNSDTPLNWYSEMRTRVNVKAKANDKAGVFFQAQDCRNIGDNPGTLALGVNSDLNMHQGYLYYAPCEKGWFKLGRMSVGLHNERLIGKVGWDNAGRAFEGAMFGRKLGDNVNLTGFAFQPVELYDTTLNADGDPAGDPMVYGLNFNLPEQQVDVFGYMVRDQGANVWGSDFNFSLMTFGAYSKRTFGPDLWYEAMFAMQTGSDDSMDFSGMMFNAQLGKVFDSGLYVGGLVDYTTGDDATTAGENENFNDLFYTGHKFRGAMDLFVNMGSVLGGELNHGIMDLGLRAKYPVNDSWKIKGDFHMFSTVEDMTNGETTLGNEIDLAAVYYDGPFSWMTGFSMFMIDDTYASGADTQNWVYSQMTVNF